MLPNKNEFKRSINKSETNEEIQYEKEEETEERESDRNKEESTANKDGPKDEVTGEPMETTRKEETPSGKLTKRQATKIEPTKKKGGRAEEGTQENTVERG